MKTLLNQNNYDYDTAHSWLEDQGLKPMEIDSILNKVFPETNEEIGIYEMLYMQKLAGIISEKEYNEKNAWKNKHNKSRNFKNYEKKWLPCPFQKFQRTQNL
jgi:hypothetical protein